MATLKELWLKVANNARLTPLELDEFARYAQETQDRNAFVANNTTPANLLNVRFPFEPIYSEIYTADTSTKRIQIPQDYKHLIVMSSGRATDTSPGGAYWGFGGLVNDDAGNNYGFETLSAANTTVAGAQNLTFGFFTLGVFVGDDAAAGVSMSNIAFIPNYRGSFWKHGIFLSGYEEKVYLSTTTWENIAPITSLTLGAGTSIKAGSAVSVYGLL